MLKKLIAYLARDQLTAAWRAGYTHGYHARTFYVPIPTTTTTTGTSTGSNNPSITYRTT